MLKVSSFANLNEALKACAQTFGDAGGELALDVDTTLVETGVYPGHNLSIRGGGNTKVQPTFKNGDYLVFGRLDGGEIRNITLRDFALLPHPDRQSGQGWACKFVKGVRATIDNVDIDLPEIPWRHDNGWWFAGFDDVRMDNVKGAARSQCLLLHGLKGQAYGADFYLGGGSKLVNFRNVSDWQPGSSIVHIAGCAGGVVLAESDLIYGGIGVLVDTTATGEQNRELFFNPGLMIDSNAEDGIRLLDGSCGTFNATGVWSCSNGTSGHAGDGIRVSPNQVGGMEATLTGCHMFNNREDGAGINGGEWSVSGGRYTDNGGWGIGFHNSQATGGVGGMPLVRRNKAGSVRRLVPSNVSMGSIRT